MISPFEAGYNAGCAKQDWHGPIAEADSEDEKDWRRGYNTGLGYALHRELPWLEVGGTLIKIAILDDRDGVIGVDLDEANFDREQHLLELDRNEAMQLAKALMGLASALIASESEVETNWEQV